MNTHRWVTRCPFFRFKCYRSNPLFDRIFTVTASTTHCIQRMHYSSSSFFCFACVWVSCFFFISYVSYKLLRTLPITIVLVQSPGTFCSTQLWHITFETEWWCWWMIIKLETKTHLLSHTQMTNDNNNNKTMEFQPLLHALTHIHL